MTAAVANHGWAAIGTFQAYYQEVLLSDYAASTVAWIPSLQIFFAYLTVSSLLADLRASHRPGVTNKLKVAHPDAIVY